MIIYSKRKILFLTIFLSFMFTAINWININNPKPPLIITKQATSINLNENLYRLINFGNNRFFSGILWIITLLESDLEQYKKRDLNSWLFLRFNSVISLDPYFYEAYLTGGKYLSIVKDDTVGASYIFERGIRVFKNDFYLKLNTAFNYYFESGNLKKALKLYEEIKFHPLAKKYFPILPSLVAKFRREKGDDLKDIFQLLISAYSRETNPVIKKKFKHSLYSLKSEIDLNCLNASQSNCKKVDYDGSPYFKDQDGIYKAKKKWKVFKLSERARKKRKKKKK
jgi:hypothetical protein